MDNNTERFARCNELIRAFETVCKKPIVRHGATYRCGIDLGTACVVIAVVDEDGCPVAGKFRYADVVRDGMVVDYIGAVDILREMKKQLEAEIGTSLEYAAAAIPPGTAVLDGGVVQNVVRAAGFELTAILDESTAANELLELKNGAIVDIGGGTTGISIFHDGKVVYTADEATGGTHFTLTLSGAMHLSYEEAELYKRNTTHHAEILPILHPVGEKVATIIARHIADKNVPEIILVGGTSCLDGLEKIIENFVGIPVYKPSNPMFVTPLGIALSSKAGA